MIDFFHLTFSPEGTYRVYRSHRIPCAEIGMSVNTKMEHRTLA